MDYINEALRLDTKDWRRCVQCIDGALACADPDLQSRGLHVCHELERAKGTLFVHACVYACVLCVVVGVKR